MADDITLQRSKQPVISDASSSCFQNRSDAVFDVARIKPEETLPPSPLLRTERLLNPVLEIRSYIRRV